MLFLQVAAGVDPVIKCNRHNNDRNNSTPLLLFLVDVHISWHQAAPVSVLHAAELMGGIRAGMALSAGVAALLGYSTPIETPTNTKHKQAFWEAMEHFLTKKMKHHRKDLPDVQ